MTPMTTRLVPLAFFCCTVVAQAASISITNTVSPMHATWRFLRGTNEASLPDITAWRNTNFNDAAFADALAPFWYDTTGDTSTLVGGTQLSDMPNNYSCFFLRRTFMVNNAAQFGALKWDAFIDDGYIAWINGVEVFRENVTGDPTRSTLATGVTEPIPINSMTRYPVTGLLHNGTNWLTVQVFNTTLGSSDIDFDCALSTIVGETVPPTITSFSPRARARS